MADCDDTLWQQGGHPTTYLMTYLSVRAREKALDVDQRTIYRKNERGALEEVAIFKRAKDAASVVLQHNDAVTTQKFEKLHERLGDLIDKVDSGIMGDPIV